ncbi:hypothetical protein [Parasitella parasitica]|uniref:BZIP domain-containing protein n=1 Tax=Parasitella parasitica TaxID=35722 RepID=A0A0B7MMZ8_9FUNG|nr:hypothetical protein [Parasitella parasitica]
MSTTDTNKQYTPKVGRHRVFSNEQRKMRNRQAQAAFRDRRSKYTNSLEMAIHNFEKTIKNLKETNNELIKRAQTAEDRSHHLASEVVSLQRLLELALADNQRLQTQIALVTSNNVVLPLSPNDSNSLAFDNMSPLVPISNMFDNTAACSSIPSAVSADQLDLFTSLNNSMLTGESPRL